MTMGDAIQNDITQLTATLHYYKFTLNDSTNLAALVTLVVMFVQSYMFGQGFFGCECSVTQVASVYLSLVKGSVCTAFVRYRIQHFLEMKIAHATDKRCLSV